MPYFNYHSMVKKKIMQSNNSLMFIVNQYKNISPCLVVVTDSGHYPIREHRWQEYFAIAEARQIKIENKIEGNE